LNDLRVIGIMLPELEELHQLQNLHDLHNLQNIPSNDECFAWRARHYGNDTWVG
jgi:hypothetical protein